MSAKNGSNTAVLVRLSEVEPEEVKWLWPGRIPLGKLTILDGDPGTAKTTLALDLAARVSRGDTMPDGSEPDLDGPRGICPAYGGRRAGGYDPTQARRRRGRRGASRRTSGDPRDRRH